MIAGTRRHFLTRTLSVVASSCVASAVRAAPSPLGAMRFLKVRHQTLLVELEDTRVLVDPCFAPGLGAPALVDAAAPALSPEGVGDLDVLCVTANDVGSYDAASTRALAPRSATDARRTSCFVADESIAKTLRHQGFKRVRVVVPGDVFTTRGLTVRVTSSRSLFGGDAVGYHFERAGRTFWHAGNPAPLDVSSEAATFAREQPAEVVAATALGLEVAGRPVTADADDAAILAALARARLFVRLGDDVHPTWLAGLVAKAHARVPKSAPGRARLVVAVPGTWYRVRPS